MKPFCSYLHTALIVIYIMTQCCPWNLSIILLFHLIQMHNYGHLDIFTWHDLTVFLLANIFISYGMSVIILFNRVVRYKYANINRWTKSSELQISCLFAVFNRWGLHTGRVLVSPKPCYRKGWRNTQLFSCFSAFKRFSPRTIQAELRPLYSSPYI